MTKGFRTATNWTLWWDFSQPNWRKRRLINWHEIWTCWDAITRKNSSILHYKTRQKRILFLNPPARRTAWQPAHWCRITFPHKSVTKDGKSGFKNTVFGKRWLRCCMMWSVCCIYMLCNDAFVSRGSSQRLDPTRSKALVHPSWCY